MYAWLSEDKAEKLKTSSPFSDTFFIQASLLEYKLDYTPENARILACLCAFFEEKEFVLDAPGRSPGVRFMCRLLAEYAVRCEMMEYTRPFREVRMTPKGEKWFADALKWRDEQNTLLDAMTTTPFAPHGGDGH